MQHVRTVVIQLNASPCHSSHLWRGAAFLTLPSCDPYPFLFGRMSQCSMWTSQGHKIPAFRPTVLSFTQYWRCIGTLNVKLVQITCVFLCVCGVCVGVCVCVRVCLMGLWWIVILDCTLPVRGRINCPSHQHSPLIPACGDSKQASNQKRRTMEITSSQAPGRGLWCQVPKHQVFLTKQGRPTFQLFEMLPYPQTCS